jgi:hypothetical protein
VLVIMRILVMGWNMIWKSPLPTNGMTIHSSHNLNVFGGGGGGGGGENLIHLDLKKMISTYAKDLS